MIFNLYLRDTFSLDLIYLVLTNNQRVLTSFGVRVLVLKKHVHVLGLDLIEKRDSGKKARRRLPVVVDYHDGDDDGEETEFTFCFYFLIFLANTH